MSRARGLAIVAASFGASARIATAQQPSMPIRPIGAIVATSADSMSTGVSIRPLTGGRVLVNDPGTHRLVLFDSTLQHGTVVADTTSRTAKSYGDGLFGLTWFTGDSSLIRDRLTGAFLVIDPAGTIARIIPAPGGPHAVLDRPPDPRGYDQAGHVVFPAPPTYFLGLLSRDFVGDTLMRGPDSAAILREDLVTRRVDTIAMLQAPRVRQAVTRRVNGGRGKPALNPMPSSDDWALAGDGTIAVVRVRDYHVDWIRPDGHVTSTPKVPADWLRLSDSAKAAIMDSVRARDSTLAATRDDGPAPLVERRVYVEPADLPDYRPPFLSGFARVDAEGNVWVRENRSELVYDIVDRNGALVDRVRLPGGTTLAGFGPGLAYLMAHTEHGVRISTARIR